MARYRSFPTFLFTGVSDCDGTCQVYGTVPLTSEPYRHFISTPLSPILENFRCYEGKNVGCRKDGQMPKTVLNKLTALVCTTSSRFEALTCRIGVVVLA